MMNNKNKIYVGNLEWSIDDEALSDFFSQVGTVVSAKVILDRDTGRSRGFGFVEFAGEKEANKAIKKLDGIDFNKRNIVVKLARPERPRPKLD
jgi:RNA recognition motif-containing protein